MGENAQEAIFIGVYIFIFVVALSATIMLFTMINDYAELSYNYGKMVEDSTLVEGVDTATYRTYTGSQLISFLLNHVVKDKFLDGESDIESLVLKDKNGLPLNFDREKESYSTLLGKIELGNSYRLFYSGSKQITIQQI